jgi:hypothetical protein
MKITGNEGYFPYQNNSIVKDAKKSDTTTQIEPAQEESRLAEAIRLYKSYTLTGLRELTAEEKEEIRIAIDAYLEESGFLARYQQGNATQADFAAFNDFLKKLCIQYGNPSDFYEFSSEYIKNLLKDYPQDPPFEVKIPSEHEFINTPKKPILTSFQPISPLQFLVTDDN